LAGHFKKRSAWDGITGKGMVDLFLDYESLIGDGFTFFLIMCLVKIKIHGPKN
jgi:hypothetical protein